MASTEKLAEEGNEIFNSIESFEQALDENRKEISPAMLYAYAAIVENVPYGNFTPSLSVDNPALIELALHAHPDSVAVLPHHDLNGLRLESAMWGDAAEP